MAGGDFCAYCNHYMGWHNQWDTVVGAKTDRCTSHTGTRCDCVKFCAGFQPSDNNGLICFDCGRNYFSHETVKRTLVSRFGASEDIGKSCQGDIVYRTFPDGMQLCCEWTLYHFMKRVKYNDLKKNQSIKCVYCSVVTTLKDFDNEGTPEFAWNFVTSSVIPLPVTPHTSKPTVGVGWGVNPPLVVPKQLTAGPITNIAQEATD